MFLKRFFVLEIVLLFCMTPDFRAMEPQGDFLHWFGSQLDAILDDGPPQREHRPASAGAAAKPVVQKFERRTTFAGSWFSPVAPSRQEDCIVLAKKLLDSSESDQFMVVSGSSDDLHEELPTNFTLSWHRNRLFLEDITVERSGALIVRFADSSHHPSSRRPVLIAEIAFPESSILNELIKHIAQKLDAAKEVHLVPISTPGSRDVMYVNVLIDGVNLATYLFDQKLVKQWDMQMPKNMVQWQPDELQEALAKVKELLGSAASAKAS